MDEKINDLPVAFEDFLHCSFETDSDVLEDLINIWIVILGGRPACLIETTHYPRDTWKVKLKLLQTFAQKNKLYVTLDPQSLKKYPRYLVSRSPVKLTSSDKQLGQLLGMTYLQPDYQDFCKLRTFLNIRAYFNSTQFITVWSEVSLSPEESTINAQRMVELWNRLIHIFPIPCAPTLNFQLEVGIDHGVIHRATHINDLTYLQSNYDEYVNDLDNFADDPDLATPYFDFHPTELQEWKRFQVMWLNEMKSALKKECAYVV